jgi:epoxyqueuosine reductase
LILTRAFNRETVREMAFECGFELAGVAPAEPADDFERFQNWRERDFAGEMRYLTDRRGDLRSDPRNLLGSAQSIVCVGKVYNSRAADPEKTKPNTARISRYAWGGDYHDLMRERLEQFVAQLRRIYGEDFESRTCVDTAPLLERSYARLAGLGWIGKNTCLINQRLGSWLFLGEVLLSIPLEPDAAPADRCGTCTRCIDACPTQAIVPDGAGGWMLDARRCLSYLTIEHRGEIEANLAERSQNLVFGCDICQEVCPWNRRAAETDEPAFAPRSSAHLLEALAEMSEDEFRLVFRRTPVWRAKYAGFLRNVALAMGNSGNPEMREPLERLTGHSDPLVARSARQALDYLERTIYS